MAEAFEPRYLLPDIPADLTSKPGVERFLKFAAENDVHDIIMMTGKHALLRQHGVNYRGTSRPLDEEEVTFFVQMVTFSSATSSLHGAVPVDRGFQFQDENGKSYRFRVSAAAYYGPRLQSTAVTMRTLSEDIRPFGSMSVCPSIASNFCPKQGLVLITGKTGSGKTTLMAGGLVERAQKSEAGEVILTAEEPIEYVFDKVDLGRSIIAQHEIPTHLESFGAAVRNFMRRAPDALFCGEVRDNESFEGLVQFSLSGHAAYATGHTNGVADSIHRFLYLAENKKAAAVDMLSSMHMIIYQELLHSLDGKRVPAREHLVFDEQVKRRLLRLSPDDWQGEIRNILRENKTEIHNDVETLVNEGLVKEEYLDTFLARSA